MADDIEVLRALAHPVRLGIVRRLADEPDICACDFTDYFTVSQPTISAHLRTLREVGLVVTRREGTTICYTLVREVLSGVAAMLGDLAGSPMPTAVSP